MMYYGIYGYEISKPTYLDGLKLTPLTESHTEVRRKASDLDSYNLTGFLEIDESKHIDQRALIFDLQGILSFIDQKNVIITNPLFKHENFERLDKDYPKKLTALKRINGGGNVISSDAFVSDSRKTFIEMALAKLKASDAENGAFRGSFFKSIETFRGSNSFIDINYYLLFSALESLSRFHLRDYISRNCSIPIANFLKSYGFDVSQDNTHELARSVSTYTHMRNALFHNGSLECEVNINGRLERLAITDYYSQFSILLSLVMIKYIGFDDGHINWNCWLDRMPLK